ncbi:MAG: hypothetical protein R2851_00530 [Caldilineaceae bacterium]
MADLLAQMTPAEKAGLMFHAMAPVNPDGSLNPPEGGFVRTPVTELVTERLMNHFNVHAAGSSYCGCVGTTGCKSWPRRRAWASP